MHAAVGQGELVVLEDVVAPTCPAWTSISRRLSCQGLAGARYLILRGGSSGVGGVGLSGGIVQAGVRDANCHSRTVHGVSRSDLCRMKRCAASFILLLRACGDLGSCCCRCPIPSCWVRSRRATATTCVFHLLSRLNDRVLRSGSKPLGLADAAAGNM